jgi:hypothetical protein
VRARAKIGLQNLAYMTLERIAAAITRRTGIVRGIPNNYDRSERRRRASSKARIANLRRDSARRS